MSLNLTLSREEHGETVAEVDLRQTPTHLTLRWIALSNTQAIYEGYTKWLWGRMDVNIPNDFLDYVGRHPSNADVFNYFVPKGKKYQPYLQNLNDIRDVVEHLQEVEAGIEAGMTFGYI